MDSTTLKNSGTGYAAADKHYPKSWLNNDIVYVKSDHDMRNTTDMPGANSAKWSLPK